MVGTDDSLCLGVWIDVDVGDICVCVAEAEILIPDGLSA